MSDNLPRQRSQEEYLRVISECDERRSRLARRNITSIVAGAVIVFVGATILISDSPSQKTEASVSQPRSHVRDYAGAAMIGLGGALNAGSLIYSIIKDRRLENRRTRAEEGYSLSLKT